MGATGRGTPRPVSFGHHEKAQVSEYRSLFYTSLRPFIFDSGPKVSHARARSYIRCMPIHTVCVPGALS